MSSSDFEKEWHSSRSICLTFCCCSMGKWLTSTGGSHTPSLLASHSLAGFTLSVTQDDVTQNDSVAGSTDFIVCTVPSSVFPTRRMSWSVTFWTLIWITGRLPFFRVKSVSRGSSPSGYCGLTDGSNNMTLSCFVHGAFTWHLTCTIACFGTLTWFFVTLTQYSLAISAVTKLMNARILLLLKLGKALLTVLFKSPLLPSPCPLASFRFITCSITL